MNMSEYSEKFTVLARKKFESGRPAPLNRASLSEFGHTQFNIMVIMILSAGCYVRHRPGELANSRPHMHKMKEDFIRQSPADSHAFSFFRPTFSFLYYCYSASPSTTFSFLFSFFLFSNSFFPFLHFNFSSLSILLLLLFFVFFFTAYNDLTIHTHRPRGAENSHPNHKL